MSIDLQVVFPVEVVRLSQIRFTSQSPFGLPVALDIIGEDFRSVDEVLINNIEAPDVLVISKNRLIAQLPDELQKTQDVSSVTVTSRRLTVSARSLLKFQVSDTPGRCSGILRLMQLFLKVLFTSPGSDIFSKRMGGGGLTPIGETFGGDEGKGIVASFTISVSSTVRQIVAIQSRDPRIPRDERLLSARVTRAGFNRSIEGIVATVELVSQAGRAATANLEL